MITQPPLAAVIPHALRRESPANGRFPRDCTIGFSHYATTTPASPYPNLNYPGDSECPGSYRQPGHAELSDSELGGNVLSAHADHAVNMGFAVWVPGSGEIIDGNAYHQIYDPNGSEMTNPGAAQPDGSKKIIWNRGRLPNERRLTTSGGNGKSGNDSRQPGVWVLDQFIRWQSMNWDFSGALQKAQMDVTTIEPDLNFRLPESWTGTG